MARLNKEQRFQNIHQQALTEFDRVQSSLRDERLQCLQDRRFYSIAGAQWEGPLGEVGVVVGQVPARQAHGVGTAVE